MTERFTENMLTGKLAIVNQRLTAMGFPFKVGFESQKPDNKRIHRFFTRDEQDRQDHDLTYPYGQPTGDAYLTMRCLDNLLAEMQRYMKQVDENQLSIFALTVADVQDSLKIDGIDYTAITSDELHTIADKAMDYITEDIHKAIIDAYDNYVKKPHDDNTPEDVII